MLIFILELCQENFLQKCNLFWTVTSTFFNFGVKAPSGALVTFCDKALVVFLSFYIFIHYLCTKRYMHTIISLTFNCIRYICFTVTTSLSILCARRIWQPEVLPTLLNARNDITARQNNSHTTFLHPAELGICQEYSQTSFGIHGRHISASSPHIHNQWHATNAK